MTEYQKTLYQAFKCYKEMIEEKEEDIKHYLTEVFGAEFATSDCMKYFEDKLGDYDAEEYFSGVANASV